RDIAENSVFVGRRDKGPREKESIPRDEFVKTVALTLDEIQKNFFERALAYRKKHTVHIDSTDDFYTFFTAKNAEKPEIHGGFAMSHWCEKGGCEEKIKSDLSVTIRCIPQDGEKETGRCIACGEKSPQRVVFAKAY
ncbi:MAG: proline--tRNA ligase, partial [Deltaproteobacteria bacterium]|nr:proline--tRNA ligase [Deltaproteobacteria bacterium]